MFHIEYVLPRYAESPYLWAWSVKMPSGLYETLVTSDKGRGLYVRKLACSPGEPLFHHSQLLTEEEFFVPENATKEQSISLLEKSLEKLGWGQDFMVLLKYA